MSFFVSQWVVRVGDVLLGILLPPALQALGFGLRYVYRRISTNYPLEGKWHCYHYSIKSGKLEFVHREWHIRKGFRRKYCGAVYEKAEKRYRLRIVEERGNFLFFVRSVNGSETFQFRSTALFTDNKQPCFGLYVALTYDDNIFSGMKILTRTKQSEGDFNEIARRHYKNYAERPLIVLREAVTS